VIEGALFAEFDEVQLMGDVRFEAVEAVEVLEAVEVVKLGKVERSSSEVRAQVVVVVRKREAGLIQLEIAVVRGR
jgi:hypothetical protein